MPLEDQEKTATTKTGWTTETILKGLALATGAGLVVAASKSLFSGDFVSSLKGWLPFSGGSTNTDAAEAVLHTSHTIVVPTNSSVSAIPSVPSVAETKLPPASTAQSSAGVISSMGGYPVPTVGRKPEGFGRVRRDVTPVTSELQITNATGTNYYQNPSVTTLSNGNRMWAFECFDSSLSTVGIDICVQVRSPDGSIPITGIVPTNVFTAGDQTHPHIKALNAGGAALTYVSPNQASSTSNTDIILKTLNANGTTAQSEFVATTIIVGPQDFPRLDIYPDDQIVLTFSDYNPNPTGGLDGSYYGVGQDCYYSNMTRVAPETVASTYTMSYQDFASVAVLPGGTEHGISWHSYNQDGSNTYNVYFQRIAKDCLTKLGSETSVDASIGDQIDPDIGVSGSHYGVTYISKASGVNKASFQEVTNTSALSSSRVLVSNTLGGDQLPKITGLANAMPTFAIGWSSNGGSGSTWHAYVQRVANGTTLDMQVQADVSSTPVSTPPDYNVPYSSILPITSTQFSVQWTGTGSGGTGANNVYERIFQIIPPPQVISSELQVTNATGPTATNYYQDGSVTTLKDGTNNRMWAFECPDGSGSGICLQVRSPDDSTAVTNITQTNAFTSGDQFLPEVKALNGGGAALVYTSINQASGSSGTDVILKYVNNDGTTRVPEFVATTVTAGNQYTAAAKSIAVYPDNQVVLIFTDEGSGFLDGSGYGVGQNCFYPNGTRVAPEKVVTTYTLGNQAYGTVGITSDGTQHGVSWESFNQDGSGTFNVYFQAMLKDCVTKLGSETPIDASAGDQELPSIATLNNHYGIVYTSTASGNALTTFQEVTNTSTLLNARLTLSTTTGGDQLVVAEGLPNANPPQYVVIWPSNGGSGSNWHLFLRSVANGTILGTQSQIDNNSAPIPTLTTTYSLTPLLSTSAFPSGDKFSVQWTSQGPGGTGNKNVYVSTFQIIPPPSIPAPVAPPTAPPVAAPKAAPVSAPVSAPTVPPVAAPQVPPAAAPSPAPIAPPVTSPVVPPPIVAPIAAPVVAAPQSVPMAQPVTQPPVATPQATPVSIPSFNPPPITAPTAPAGVEGPVSAPTGGSNTAAIAGGVAGGVVGIAAGGGLFLFFRRNKKEAAPKDDRLEKFFGELQRQFPEAVVLWNESLYSALNLQHHLGGLETYAASAKEFGDFAAALAAKLMVASAGNKKEGKKEDKHHNSQRTSKRRKQDQDENDSVATEQISSVPTLPGTPIDLRQLTDKVDMSWLVEKVKAELIERSGIYAKRNGVDTLVYGDNLLAELPAIASAIRKEFPKRPRRNAVESDTQVEMSAVARPGK